MATKQENRDLVIELSEELGLEFDVPELDELKATEWADMVSDLKAKKRDADNETIVDNAVETESEDDSDADNETIVDNADCVYYVKPGCAITTRKGVVSSEKSSKNDDCSVIKPEWVNGGSETLDRLVKTGHIGKR